MTAAQKMLLENISSTYLEKKNGFFIVYKDNNGRKSYGRLVTSKHILDKTIFSAKPRLKSMKALLKYLKGDDNAKF